MEWISINDRLPNSPGHYLAVADWMGVVEKAEFDGTSQWNVSFGGSSVTHWMPLPEPPKDL